MGAKCEILVCLLQHAGLQEPFMSDRHSTFLMDFLASSRINGDPACLEHHNNIQICYKKYYRERTAFYLIVK